MTFQWKMVPSGADLTVTAGVLPDDWLGHINTKVTGASGDANAYWEVATYSAVSPKYVLLRPKNGNPGRILIFGQNGGTPNAAAVRSATASLLYIAFHPTSTSNSNDASWLTAQPLTGGDYMPGIPLWQMTAGTTFRLWYVDSEAGMMFNITLGTATSCAMAGAGWLIQDPAGTNIPTILGNGSTSLRTTIWGQTQTSGIIGGLVSSNSGFTNGNQHCFVRYNGLDESIWRYFDPLNSTQLVNSSTKRAWFLPIYMAFSSTDLRFTLFGKFRQIAFGPKSLKESTLEASAGSPSIFAYAHSYHNATPQDAVWFTNFDV